MYVNAVAVLAAGVLSMVLGFFWYAPAVFGRLWMKESGLTEKDIKSGPGTGYLLSFAVSLIMAVAMSILANYGGTRTVLGGLKLGALVGLGIVATSFAANYIFSKKSLKLYLVDAGYFVTHAMITGVIVSVIR